MILLHAQKLRLAPRRVPSLYLTPHPPSSCAQGKKEVVPKLTPQEAHFQALGDKFKSFHKDPVNIALHFGAPDPRHMLSPRLPLTMPPHLAATTPMAVLAAVSMINKACRTSALTMLVKSARAAMLAHDLRILTALPSSLVMLSLTVGPRRQPSHTACPSPTRVSPPRTSWPALSWCDHCLPPLLPPLLPPTTKYTSRTPTTPRSFFFPAT